MLKNIDCGYWLEPIRRGASNESNEYYVLSRKLKRYQIDFFFLKTFSFLVVNFLNIFD